jgi:sterol desaturase/sphingolipid hydroxylase (fatty acid hydroxylase superfamily)
VIYFSKIESKFQPNGFSGVTSMAHYPVSTQKEPIRLFKSDFLEFFTHITPTAVVLIWLPVAIYFMVAASVQRPSGTSPFFIPAGFFAGLFLWTFSEYILHRFLFHFPPRNEQQYKIFFLFHGVHHAQPQVKTRLVMPPVVSIPMSLLFYGFFHLLLAVLLNAPAWVGPLTSGFIIGYLIYDLTHYATHHLPMRSGFFKYLKRYHLRHHYKTPDQRFGVSSPLWDVVFGTKPEDQ